MNLGFSSHKTTFKNPWSIISGQKREIIEEKYQRCLLSKLRMWEWTERRSRHPLTLQLICIIRQDPGGSWAGIRIITSVYVYIWRCLSLSWHNSETPVFSVGFRHWVKWEHVLKGKQPSMWICQYSLNSTLFMNLYLYSIFFFSWEKGFDALSNWSFSGWLRKWILRFLGSLSGGKPEQWLEWKWKEVLGSSP